MKQHNYVPKATCPACGRAVNRNNAGVLDPHYDQRTGKECPGSSMLQICPSCGQRVTVAEWADFEGVCQGCAAAIRELPA